MLLSQQRVGRETGCGTDTLPGAHTHSPNLKRLAWVAKMSLADASEKRKERLLALRKRKAGEVVEEAGYVPRRTPSVFGLLICRWA